VHQDSVRGKELFLCSSLTQNCVKMRDLDAMNRFVVPLVATVTGK
jgi:hypothetical protein